MKKNVKIFVNLLTSSRLIATFFMPLMFSTLPAHIFILITGLIFLTDLIDGKIARKFEVSTMFGSLLDMTADKLFGVIILYILSTMYPIMTIPLLFEIIISTINVSNRNKKTGGNSSYLGKAKTCILWVSIILLFLVGLSPELINSLNKVKISEELIATFRKPAIFIKNAGLALLNFINNNKTIITDLSVASSIISETVVATDYTIKSTKKISKNDKKIRIADLIRNKKFLKEILFNEKYYNLVKDEQISIMEKLIPNKYYDELTSNRENTRELDTENVKKLTFNHNNNKK